MVKKGSDLAKFHIYMNGKNTKIQPTLALAPLLYTMQPSGHLYQNMVETGITTNVEASTWLDQDFNVVFLGAIYSPSNDPKKVESSLLAGIEKGKPFTEVELNRVKSLMKTQGDLITKDAVALGSRLSDYTVAGGQWDQYFKDLDSVEKVKLDDVNQTLKQFLVADHRIDGDILPTPEDQKKAQQQNSKEAPKTLDQVEAEAEPLKDPKVYQQEVAEFLKTSKQYVESNEKKIIRGKLKNGMKYALFPVETRDDRTYATITMDFGTEKSLFNKGTVVDLTSYLLLRGSDKYSLQDIADKSIDAGGAAYASADGNGMTINIQSKSEKFDEFFKFVLDVMKNPKFEQSQFDLIKSQSLSSLDRPYTEPDVVAGLTLSRLLEEYQPGDLRYHFEPELAKQQLKNATQEQVKELYERFFAMNHAQIAITGEFDAKKMQKLLNQEFGRWNGKQPYQKILIDHVDFPAQQVHVLSEQREFGSYQSVLSIPVGKNHPDASALILMNYILGESQISSRLAQELREKNALVYGFGSGLQLDRDTNVGALSISANYTSGRSAQVSASIHKVLNDLVKNGVTEQELEAAKADIMKKRVTALEDERNIHGMLNLQLETNKTLQDRIRHDQELTKLTVADVNRVIKKYIKPEHLVEVMADQYGQAAKK
ncbi:zinc protease [Acinetobacter pittii PHEA-2]|uniref:Zinc protease n=2 Tax=Acinetobacter pittii TaxID=48296 RepID=F0KKG2_ACIP2